LEPTPARETKVCPVCDATIRADARTCPSCLTDLTLFDLGGEASPEASEIRAGEGKSIDDILASIMEGKTDQPEIFESLKTVATSQKAYEDVVAEPPPAPPSLPQIAPRPPPAPESPKEFLCPVCDTVVGPRDRVCPGCGAEFSEGETTEYECPVCRAPVPADASVCSNCGVHFESDGEIAGAPIAEPSLPSGQVFGRQVRAPSSGETPRTATVPVRIEKLRSAARDATPEIPYGDRKLIARELPRLVNDVKPLLVSAKRIGLDIENGKRLINEAVTAGKKRDIERAVKLISDARKALDIAFIDFLGSRIQSFSAELDRASGEVNLGPELEQAVSNLERRRYDASWDALETATRAFQSQAKEYSEARTLLEATDRLVTEVRSMAMDVRDVERLQKQSRASIDRRELANGLRLARQANERILQTVPAFVQEEMRKARNALLDLKMRGHELSKEIGVLKEASARVKEEDWREAVRFLREFNKELEKAVRA
jgi:RNA polymerase subunit RPABC4/transcription elongation factor Spt4